ncbi:MAG: hypothetical protein PHV28_09735 [Kiritimatiellae bacterium]|nr:hypothetical protein [Kiritimatiellia bacterium]
MSAPNNSQSINEPCNGRADLLDFFPVWLDLGEALALLDAMPGGGDVTVRLSQKNNALAYVQTGLTTNAAGSYLVSDVAGLASAETRRITGEGVNLPDAFVDSLRADPSKGVILIEGRSGDLLPPGRRDLARGQEGLGNMVVSSAIADWNMRVFASLLSLVLEAGQDICISPIIFTPNDWHRVSGGRINRHAGIPHGLGSRRKTGRDTAGDGVYGSRKQRVQ